MDQASDHFDTNHQWGVSGHDWAWTNRANTLIKIQEFEMSLEVLTCAKVKASRWGPVLRDGSRSLSLT